MCEQLDKESGFEQPVESWFWPKSEDEAAATEEENEEEEDEECDFEPHEQLQMLTGYLRTEYLYCLWCGTKFDGGEDLGQNCPGDTREAHDD